MSTLIMQNRNLKHYIQIYKFKTGGYDLFMGYNFYIVLDLKEKLYIIPINSNKRNR